MKPFKHGEEGTHFACQEMIDKLGGKTGCCGCNNHDCRQPQAEEGVAVEDAELRELFMAARHAGEGQMAVWNEEKWIKAVKDEIKKAEKRGALRAYGNVVTWTKQVQPDNEEALNAHSAAVSQTEHELAELKKNV